MVFTTYKPALATPNPQNDTQKQSHKNTLLTTRYIDKSQISYIVIT